jgi:hypothetical protein
VSKANRHIGSSLDDFLREEGVLEEARAIAIKEAVAFQVQRAMETENISKVEMARRMWFCQLDLAPLRYSNLAHPPGDSFLTCRLQDLIPILTVSRRKVDLENESSSRPAGNVCNSCAD